MKMSAINKVLESVGDVDDTLLRKEAGYFSCSQSMKGRVGRTKGMVMSPEFRAKVSAGTKGRKVSDVGRANMKAARALYPPQMLFACSVCGIEVVKANLNRWHNGNCNPARNARNEKRRLKTPTVFSELFGEAAE